MTSEQIVQRIAAAGNASRREDQVVLAKAGEDKARVMAELCAIAGVRMDADRPEEAATMIPAGRDGDRHPRMNDPARPGRARDRARELAMARAVLSD